MNEEKINWDEFLDEDQECEVDKSDNEEIDDWNDEATIIEKIDLE